MNNEILKDLHALGDTENCSDTEKLKKAVAPLMEKFDSMGSEWAFAFGTTDLCEIVELKHKPREEKAIKTIQEYFGLLGISALKKLCGEYNEKLGDEEIKYSAKLTLYGENGYTTSNLPEFVYGILYDLPSADGFKITSEYSGPGVVLWFEENGERRFYESCHKIAEIGEQEDIVYSALNFFYDSGEGCCRKFENGHWIDLEEKYAQAILDKEYPTEWFCWGVNLWVDFPFEKYPDILQKLHDCVKKHVPEKEYEYCESEWDDDPPLMVNWISWNTKKLREVQDFLDEINAILEPIVSECDCRADGEWFYYEEPFAVATWAWTDEGFKVIGTEA